MEIFYVIVLHSNWYALATSLESPAIYMFLSVDTMRTEWMVKQAVMLFICYYEMIQQFQGRYLHVRILFLHR